MRKSRSKVDADAGADQSDHCTTQPRRGESRDGEKHAPSIERRAHNIIVLLEELWPRTVNNMISIKSYSPMSRGAPGESPKRKEIGAFSA